MRLLAVGPSPLTVEPSVLSEVEQLSIQWVSSPAACTEALINGAVYDAVLCDVGLTQGVGENALALARQERPDLPVVVLTPEAQERAAVAALQRGAADYLVVEAGQPLPGRRLRAAVERAIEHLHLRQAADRRARLLEILRAGFWEVRSDSDLAEVLSAAADQAHRRLPYDQVAIYLEEPGSGRLALCAIAGADPAQISPRRYHLDPGEGTPGQAIAARRICRVDDFARAPHLAPAFRLPGQAGLPELSAPILQGERAIGAITVTASRPSLLDFAEEELAWLAEHVAMAMRTAASLRQEAEHRTREALLTHISHVVNTSLNLNQVLQQAVAEVGEQLKVDRCVLLGLDLTARTMTVRHEYINPLLAERRKLKGRTQKLAGSLKRLARRLQSGEVIASTDQRVHPLLRWVWPELRRRYEIRSLIVAPVLGSSMSSFYCLGLMQVTHAREWGAGDQGLVRGLADQLALALRNAELFDAMQQAARELQLKNKELEAFVYTASHDLQAPVVSLRGFASLLQARHGAQLDERGALYVERIAANAEFLARLLKDLLELSRVGRLEEPDEAVAVETVIEPALNDLAPLISQRGVSVELPPAWPVVLYPRIRLRQIFFNLLSNAVKFLGSQPQPRVEVGWRRILPDELAPVANQAEADSASASNGEAAWEPASQIEFFVKDNGIGIHPDQQQRIFDPFHRLKAVEVEGTGVGLSIVRRILEQRGGAVRLESTPGLGSTFYFAIPEAPGG
jgi:signal transduction histidine kinase/DNA-binding NarL/FixJ family response regulator